MGIPYEAKEGYPSLDFLVAMTIFEIVLVIFSVGVLGIAFLMFVRLFDALSPPTKALTWVVGADVILALFLLAFMCFQMHYYARGEAIPQGEPFCHYCSPLVLALVLFGWLAQPVIAWTTLKTLRNEAVPERRLRRVFYWCAALALVDYVWGVAKTPGRIVNGSFCIMKAKTQGTFDARIFADLLGIATFIASVVLYAKSFRHLGRLKRKLAKDTKKAVRQGAGGGSLVDGEGDEVKEPQPPPASSSYSSKGAPVVPGSPTWRTQAMLLWRPRDSASDRDAELAEVDPQAYDADDDDGDSDSDSGASDDSDDSEAPPMTLEELQARTQAARAAVNILLPNRTDDMAGREGPYGLRRRRQQRQRSSSNLLEDGVDLSALVDLQPPAARSARGSEEDEEAAATEEGRHLAAAASSLSRSSRRHGGSPQGGERVVELCGQASRALVWRACILMLVYYLPTFILYGWLGYYKFTKPPPIVVPFMGLVFFLGTPVLQTFALLQLAVTIGGNILWFYRQYMGEEEAAGLLPRDKSSGEGSKGEPHAVAFYMAQGARGNAESGAGEADAGKEEDVEAAAAAPAAKPVRRPAQGAPLLGAGFLYEQEGRLESSSSSSLDPETPPEAAPQPQPQPQPQPPQPEAPSSRRRPAPARRQPMQALATIYEVAFKGRGRDAAATLRHTAGGGRGSSDGDGGPSPALGSDVSDHQQPHQPFATPSDGEEGDSPSRRSSSVTSGETLLRRNALVQEMLGVRVQQGSSGESGSSDRSSGNVAAAGSRDENGDEDVSEGRAGPAGGEEEGEDSPGFRTPGGYSGRRQQVVASRWHAESEISSLTDAYDYQAGSLASSPAKSLRPRTSPGRRSFFFLPRPGSNQPAYAEPPPPLQPPWRWSAARDRGLGTPGGTSSLLPEGGRSIVTESEWIEWQSRQQQQQQQQQRQQPPPPSSSLQPPRPRGQEQHYQYDSSSCQEMYSDDPNSFTPTDGSSSNSSGMPSVAASLLPDAGRSVVSESDLVAWENQRQSGSSRSS